MRKYEEFKKKISFLDKSEKSFEKCMFLNNLIFRLHGKSRERNFIIFFIIFLFIFLFSNSLVTKHNIISHVNVRVSRVLVFQLYSKYKKKGLWLLVSH